MVLDAIEAHVLTPDALDTILANALGRFASAQVDELANQREWLTNVIAEVDRKIRRTATHAINGMIDEGDAKAITAPLIAERDLAKHQLAALPAQREMPPSDEIDAEAFRVAVLEAWTDQPLEERRSALAQLLPRITPSPASVQITDGD